MGYLVVKKATVSGKTTAITYVCETETEARRKYHSTLVSTYNEGDNLEHLLCMLVNDIGGSELKEHYFKPKEEPKKEETEAETTPSEG